MFNNQQMNLNLISRATESGLDQAGIRESAQYRQDRILYMSIVGLIDLVWNTFLTNDQRMQKDLDQDHRFRRDN